MADPIKLIVDSALEVQGREDTPQLEVRGHTTQTQPLQQWEDSSGTALAEMTGDGRLRLGSLDTGAPSAQAEVNSAITLPSTMPLRGLQTLGRITGALTAAVAWAVHELELLGSGGVSGLHAALRAKLTLGNSGGAASAAVSAGEFEVVNGPYPLGKAVGVRSKLDNQTGGVITEAIAFEVASPENGGAITTLVGLKVPDLTQGGANYALQTGQGPVQLGDYLEIKAPTTPPGAPTAGSDMVRVYPKSNGRLYARNDDGLEYDLTSGGDAADVTYTPGVVGNWTGGNDPGDVDNALDQLAGRVMTLETGGSGEPTGVMHIWPTDTPPTGYLLCYGQAVSRTTYADLFAVIGTTYGAGDGSTTFNLPDLRGRFPLGQDDMGGASADRVTAAAADTLGGTGGAETHTLTVAELASHRHSFAAGSTGAGVAPSGGNSTGYTHFTGGGGAHNNVPPYITLNFIMKY